MLFRSSSVVNSTEYQNNPMGIDEASPRLSWKIKSGQRNTLQKSYQIRVGKDSAALTKGNQLLWDSGEQQKETSVLLPYSGPALESSTRYYWQVKIKDNHGNESPWSMVRNWHTGLLKPADWTAQWIGTTIPTVAQHEANSILPFFHQVTHIIGLIQ